MIKNKKLVIILLILILMFAALAVKIIVEKKASAVEPSASQINLEALQETDFASSAFKKVKIGDSFEQVESKMGELEETEKENDYDVYLSSDQMAHYYFYFKDGILDNVSLRAA